MRLKLCITGLVLLGAVAGASAAEAPAAVAVLDFSVPAAADNRWAWAESGVADLLQIELQQKRMLLLDRDAIHAVLQEQRLAASGRSAKDSLSLAQLLNAQYLISGKIAPLAAGRFRVEAVVFSVEASETKVTAMSEGDFPKELSRVLSDVAKQIAGKLPAGSGFNGEAEPPARAPKPEALILFYRGVNACALGQPGLGAACFMNAASLDPDFTVPLLWEIKAYEMAGLAEPAAIRREEMATVLQHLGMATTSPTNIPVHTGKPVLALLHPVVTAGDSGLESSALDTALIRSLLATDQVRLFAFEGIGASVAEQDLRLSSFFAGQNAPRYGRWLAADGLVLCRVHPDGSNQTAMELSLVNPLNAVVMARSERTGPAATLPGQIPALVGELLGAWTNRLAPAIAPVVTPESSAVVTNEEATDLRPIYRDLVAAMAQVRREPGSSDSHRALANAFGATGRPRLAAYEIEQCLQRLDIHAPHADNTFLGTHRWLFWEPSPASGAAGLVNPAAITNLSGQLLAVYPQSLAAGCLRYNLAVTAWRAKDWPEAITQAQKSRQILQSLVAHFDRNAKIGANRGEAEFEMLAATFFLEGSGLRESGKRDEARLVFHQGLDFMLSNKVRNFCLPLGPYLGDFFGPERVYGCGGDPPGIQSRLEQELVKLGETIARPTQAAPPPVPVAATAVPGADWIQKGQLEIKNKNYLPALEYYQMAVAAGVATRDCPGLATALLEIALDRNLEHPQAEVEKLRRELGLPPVQASWVELFAAARQYQTGSQFDLEKAAACYRGAIDFLEHPEQRGVYRLEKEPGCDRTNLWWGKSIGEVDLLWTKNYDTRWHSAAFYLAQCLIQLDRKEEAAQWLRQIAIKIGGDDSVALLEKNDWNNSSWSSSGLGVRSAQLLKELHQDLGTPKFGEVDGPYKRPVTGTKARPVPSPPLPPPDPMVLPALTNLLVELAHATSPPNRNSRIQSFIAQYGHDIVPAVLALLPQSGEPWDENALMEMLKRTATQADAAWVVVACTKHWGLIALANRLDPRATAEALAEVWREHSGAKFVPPSLIHEVVHARVRPLYALVLDQISEKRINHHADVFLMDEAAGADKSDELEAGLRDALARCLRLKLQESDHYELRRISQIAIRHGVPEGIEGLLIADEADPEKLRADLGTLIELPSKEDEVVAFLKANQSRWTWDPHRQQFQRPF